MISFKNIDLFAALIGILPKRMKPVRHLLTQHMPRILEEEVRPHFQHPRAAYAQHSERKESKQELDFQDQAWKTDRLDCVEILTWIVLQVKVGISAPAPRLHLDDADRCDAYPSWRDIQHPDFGPIQHMIFPPLLTLLEDWEPPYKQRGVQLLRHVIVENSAPADVRRTGLGELFFEVNDFSLPVLLSIVN